jgi:hypothetical protein
MRISAASWSVGVSGAFDVVGMDLMKVGKAGRGGNRCRTTLLFNSRSVNKYPSNTINDWTGVKVDKRIVTYHEKPHGEVLLRPRTQRVRSIAMIRHSSFSIAGRCLNPSLAPEVLDILRGQQFDEDGSSVAWTCLGRNHAAELTWQVR